MAKNNRRRFRPRAFLSLSLFFSFLVAAFSGVALFLRPEGSVASWIDWRFLGLDKKGWEGVHTLFCLAFVVVAVIHLALNGKSLVHYIRNRAASGFRFRWEPPAALFLVAGLLLLAVYRVPPLSKVIELRGAIKHGRDLVRIQAPEADFEKLTLSEASAYLNLNAEHVMGELKAQGLDIPSEFDSLQAIAEGNRLTPQELYGRILRISPEQK